MPPPARRASNNAPPLAQPPRAPSSAHVHPSSDAEGVHATTPARFRGRRYPATRVLGFRSGHATRKESENAPSPCTFDNSPPGVAASPEKSKPVFARDDDMPSPYVGIAEDGGAQGCGGGACVFGRERRMSLGREGVVFLSPPGRLSAARRPPDNLPTHLGVGAWPSAQAPGGGLRRGHADGPCARKRS